MEGPTPTAQSENLPEEVGKAALKGAATEIGKKAVRKCCSFECEESFGFCFQAFISTWCSGD